MGGSWRRCARRDRLPRGLRSASEWHVPADQLAAEIVRRPLARSASGAAPPGEAALVGQEGEVAGALGRIAVPAVTRASAMDPVLAGAARRRGRRPQGAGRERARCPHLALLAAPRDRAISRGDGGSPNCPCPVKCRRPACRWSVNLVQRSGSRSDCPEASCDQLRTDVARPRRSKAASRIPSTTRSGRSSGCPITTRQ